MLKHGFFPLIKMKPDSYHFHHILLTVQTSHKFQGTEGSLARPSRHSFSCILPSLGTSKPMLQFHLSLYPSFMPNHKQDATESVASARLFPIEVPLSN